MLNLWEVPSFLTHQQLAVHQLFQEFPDVRKPTHDDDDDDVQSPPPPPSEFNPHSHSLLPKELL